LHVGLHARLSTYPYYGLVVCACKTLREAVAQTQRYEGLAHDLGRSRLVEDAGVATYYWDSPWLAACTPPQARHLCESVLAGIVTFASWLAHERLPVREIGLPCAAPDAAIRQSHRQVFDTTVVYGVTTAYGRFDAGLLDRPCPTPTRACSKVLQRHAEELLRPRLRETAEPRIVTEVRREVAAQLATIARGSTRWRPRWASRRVPCNASSPMQARASRPCTMRPARHSPKNCCATCA
jgi:hypothetical protein